MSITSILLKLGFLEFPAVLILFYWRRLGVGSKALYMLSWLKTSGYLVWLLLVAVISSLDAHPSFHWISGSSIPANLLVFWPLFSALAAFALLLCTGIAQKVERGFMAGSNVLMVILWASSVVAPN